MTVRVLSQTGQRVLLGAGATRAVRDEVEALDVRRVLIVASRSVAHGTPVVGDVEKLLGQRHAGTFVGIGAHTPAADVEDAVAKADAVDADALLSIGGGAVIDGTKHVVHARSEGLTTALPAHVALPTTLSAAEFTHLAGITRAGVKQGISDPRLVPTLAVLDPEAARHTPRTLWAATGVRSLDHAFEGILTGAGDPAVEGACAEAIRLLWEGLPSSVQKATDLEAAARCQEGAYRSAVGITRAGAARGLSHAIGKAIGATYGIPHGVTSAITMPPVLALMGDRKSPGMERIADAIGMGRDTGRVADATARFIASVGIERRPLREYGVRREDIPRIATYAVGSADPAVVRLVEGMW